MSDLGSDEYVDTFLRAEKLYNKLVAIRTEHNGKTKSIRDEGIGLLIAALHAERVQALQDAEKHIRILRESNPRMWR